MSIEITTIETTTPAALTTPAGFETIDASELDAVSGGVDANANVNVSLDASQTIRDVGNGLGRVVGCATGASSLREFGNCMLTGQLGNVPPAPQPQATGG